MCIRDRGVGEASDTYADAIDKVTGSYDDYCRRVQQAVQSMCIEDNNQKLVEQLKQALGLS